MGGNPNEKHLTAMAVSFLHLFRILIDFIPSDEDELLDKINDIVEEISDYIDTNGAKTYDIEKVANTLCEVIRYLKEIQLL